MELTALSAKRAYFDTNIFIYLLEEHPEYYEKISKLIAHLDAIHCEIFTSELTLAECLVKPFADDDTHSQENYVQSLSSSEFLTVEPVTKEVLIKAAQLRAELKNKLPDSIHLASAVCHSCDLFVGNDKRLRSGDAIKVFNI